MTNLPANVYRVKQRDFTAIPREPWVYWIPDDLRKLFETLPALGEVAQPRQGLATANNFRFLRGWWEVGVERVAFGCRDADEAQATGKRWFPYMKGGGYRKWYGNQDFVINWSNDGVEIDNFDRAVIRNPDYYFREGVTWTDLGASGFSARISPGGFIFDVSGSCAFPRTAKEIPGLLAVMNTGITGYLLSLLNPTLHFQVGDLKRLPVVRSKVDSLESIVGACVRFAKTADTWKETTFSLVTPPCWTAGLERMIVTHNHLADLESQINDEVYRLYGISDADRAAIEAELAGDPIPEDEEEIAAYLDDDDDEKIEPPMGREELAVRWISYAVGVVLGRFRPGVPGALGSGVYRREDFAVGSLPAPDESEFDALVGPPERFAYVDETGGRHIFPAEVEAALRDRAVGDGVALDDGIAVLDAGHPRDLPTLVERALRLMLGGDAAQEVIAEVAGGDLRKFLEKDFFTKWHIKWYNIPYQAKAPVYWPLQSANRRYGFVLFHEKINKTTLYTLQRDYLDYKINGLKQRIGDLTAALETRQGSQRKRVARQVATLRETLAEVEAFAKTMARIVREGYEPAPNWIDDRVILRMAPLWELIPLWEKYPQKHWQRLQAGEYDWSHIALHYWPARVRAACRENKSYAIAHGHPEWYAGE